ncbi:MAG: TIGR00269 family protein [Candidatus Aenigmarchaeota archaeon]|nr:TIGR00269 family protein [Candidatus Aenigmarchaeota archaeon]
MADLTCACGSKAIYTRKHEGNSYCASCFKDQFEKRVKRTIRENGLIGKNEVIVVGLSGGKDSSVSLVLMKKIFGERPDIRIIAVSIDEGIEHYRDKSLEVTKKLTRKLGVDHYIVRFKSNLGSSIDDVMAAKAQGENKNLNSCTFCGVFRRYLLNRAARELGATKVCTGHNMDDEAQAVLINYLKGDLKRLARMGPKPALKSNDKFIPRIKPLRDLPEKEVALYALITKAGNYWGECPYVSGIRFEVRDFLNDVESKHSGTKFSFLRTFDAMLPVLRESASKSGLSEITECENCGEPCSGDVCKACELLDKLDVNIAKQKMLLQELVR